MDPGRTTLVRSLAPLGMTIPWWVVMLSRRSAAKDLASVLATELPEIASHHVGDIRAFSPAAPSPLPPFRA